MPSYDPQGLQACIDLGSNSFHLLVGRWREGRIELVERYSERVQLGDGVRASGKISTAAAARGLACLARFDAVLSQHPIERYWALGTNTFRVADNADDFVSAAEKLGIRIATISGVQEAVLIYAGVLSALPFDDARRLVIDIGGGSTEVIVGHGATRTFTESLGIGSVAWRDTFFAHEHATKSLLEEAMNAARQEARTSFERVAHAVRSAGWDEAHAASGTIKMLAGVCAAHGFPDGQVSQRALLALQAECLTHTLAGSEMPGLKERRRDLLLPGWSILLGLMQAFDIAVINFSPTALREGMLDFMVRNSRTLEVLDSAVLPELRRRN